MLRYFKQPTPKQKADAFLLESQHLAIEHKRQAEYHAALAKFHEDQVRDLMTPVRKEALDVHQ